MCSPTLALMGMTTVMQMQQQNAAADAQEDALEDAAANSAMQTQIEQNEINDQAADQVSLRVRQALIERSRLKVAANESGIAGRTVDALSNKVDARKGWDISRITSGQASRLRQSSMNNRSRQAGYNSQRSQITRMSPVTAGLQIAGAHYARQDAIDAAKSK